MKSRILFFAFSFLIYPATAQNESQPAVQTLDKLLDILRVLMDEQHIPGLMRPLLTRDSVLYHSGLGMANL